MAEFRHRWPTALAMQTIALAIYVLWRVCGLMLIGMALFKLGVFSARCSRRFYATLITAAVVVGVPVILYGVHCNFAVSWEPAYAKFSVGQYNYWASLFVSLGWVGVLMLACRQAWLDPITRPLAAVGRMALTNYLMQTLICTTLFYGHGFGLYGEVERMGQIGIVCVIWVFQLIVSPLWLRYFLMGPAEWLWRALTYLQLPPLRRRTPIAAPGIVSA
jgi:uncharacterized protein